MDSKTAIQIYTSLKDLGTRIWIDGGWGVDALLGRQTRRHNDLDIVVEKKRLEALRKYFELQQYTEAKPAIARPHNFVLSDHYNNEIDVHVIEIDFDGNGTYGPVENGETYPANSLKGRGKIDNIDVDCISAEYVVKFHSGYDLKEKDYQDVLAICNAFNLEIPKNYLRAPFRNDED